MKKPTPFPADQQGQRRVRSFVLREGRITRAQRSALDRLWQRFGIETGQTLDYGALFGRNAPVILEIGFGNGDALCHMALADPGADFIGIEVHRPGIGSALLKLEHNEVSNVRVACADAAELIETQIPPGSLAGVRLYFPDPWPKKRHHKRRIVQDAFVAHVHAALTPGGLFHLATDWAPYAEHMLETLSHHCGFRNQAGPGHFSKRPDWRPQTRFERRGLRLGHQVFDLLFEKLDGRPDLS